MTEVSNILAKYPKWDDSPHCLKLPTMSQESNEPIPDSTDHIKPVSGRGNVYVKDVSLQTSWNCRRYQVEQACQFIKLVLAKLDQNKVIDILSPSGTMLFNLPLTDDNIDESLDCPSLPISSDKSADPNIAETCIEVEDALGKVETADTMTASPKWKIKTDILFNGKFKSKAQVLAELSKYREQVGSMDHLYCVQDIEWHIQNKNIIAYASSESLPPPSNDTEVLLISDCVASLLSCNKKIWLCVVEVNGLKLDGQSVPYIINLDILLEDTVMVSYQVLGLCPATLNDDPDGVYDWRTYWMDEKSFTVPRQLIQLINPKIFQMHTAMPWYLLQSNCLIASAMSIFQELAISSLKNIPKIVLGKEYPYWLMSGEIFQVFETGTH